MKRIILICLGVVLQTICLAQAPQSFNYQGVARGLSGSPLPSQSVSLRIAILQDTPTGTEVYRETHNTTTSNLGLFMLRIGEGNPELGFFENIFWGSGRHYLQIELDENGVDDFELIGTSQLLSVPYALYAEEVNDKGKLEIIGNTIYHSTSSGIKDSIVLVSKGNKNYRSGISSTVCIGDSIHFIIEGEAIDSAFWLSPSGKKLNFQDTSFILQNNLLTSGIYEAIIYNNGRYFSFSHWAEVEECPVDVRDDFIIAYQGNKQFQLLSNDKDNTEFSITKIDNQGVNANSTIALSSLPELNIKIGSSGKNIFLEVDVPIDTLLQFTYEACDISGFCDEGTVTAKIDLLPDTNNIITLSEAFEIIINANENDTLDFANKTIIVSGRPFHINKVLTIKNCTIKRDCSGVSYLAQASPANADTIIVESADPFAIGDWLLIVNGPEHINNSSGGILSIKDIIGDTIITFQKFKNPMPIGAKVIHQFPLVRPQPNSNFALKFENVVFDGNKECNSHTFDWRYNSTIRTGEGMMINNCTFKNMPSENIFMCGGTVKNSFSYNLNGSFVHGSCSSTNTFESYVLNNYSENTCLIAKTINGHNEGWFTYSANVHYFNVLNNIAINGGESCFGAQGLDDEFNILTGNHFENFPKKKAGTANGHPNPDDISDNTYINVPN